jgi:hypothetical protein
MMIAPADGRPSTGQELRPFGRNARHLREHKKEGLAALVASGITAKSAESVLAKRWGGLFAFPNI